MKLFIAFLLFTVLSNIRCSDANANSTETDGTSNNATAPTAEANSVANLNSTDADGTSNQTAAAAAAAADTANAAANAEAAVDTAEAAAVAAAEAAQTAEENPGTEKAEEATAVAKEDADVAKTAATEANDAAKDAAESAAEADGKCLKKRPNAVPYMHFMHFKLKEINAPKGKELLEADANYLKEHHKEIHAAIQKMKVYHQHKHHHGGVTPTRGQRYLRIRDKIKYDGHDCKLFHGFHHLHIPRVKCGPQPNCNKKTDIGHEENTPINFKSYHVYAVCPGYKVHHLHKIAINVATACECMLICKK